MFTNFASLKHFRQYLSGQITHPSVWAAQGTNNFYYSKIDIYDVFTKKIYVDEEQPRRKAYFDELNKFNSSGRKISSKSGDHGDYTFYFTLDLRKINFNRLQDLIMLAQNDAAYESVVKNVIEEPRYRCGKQDEGKRIVFSHILLKGVLEIQVENTEGITRPKPDIFPYREIISAIKDEKCVSIDNHVLTENDCNHFVRKIMKQEVALFIREIYDLKKPKSKS